MIIEGEAWGLILTTPSADIIVIIIIIIIIIIISVNSFEHVTELKHYLKFDELASSESRITLI